MEGRGGGDACVFREEKYLSWSLFQKPTPSEFLLVPMGIPFPPRSYELIDRYFILSDLTHPYKRLTPHAKNLEQNMFFSAFCLHCNTSAQLRAPLHSRGFTHTPRLFRSMLERTKKGLVLRGC